MPEPTAIATAVFSGLSTLLKVAQQSAHFAEVTNEVRQLQINVRLADDSINTAQRLLRLKGHYLDNDLQHDVTRSLTYTTNILQALRESVEGCRKDIETKGTVSLKNRTFWVIFKNQDFLSKLATLTNAMNALNRDINRLELAKTPEIVLPPPDYSAAVGDDQSDYYGPANGFPRSPTMRKKLEHERSQQSSGKVMREGDGIDIRSSKPYPLRPSLSTFSFASATTNPEYAFEQPQEDEGKEHVESVPTWPYDLPGGVSLGYNLGSSISISESRSDYLVEEWEREEADVVDVHQMLPPPVPPKPRAPRRRSNYI